MGKEFLPLSVVLCYTLCLLLGHSMSIFRVWMMLKVDPSFSVRKPEEGAIPDFASNVVIIYWSNDKV
jgi:hypothetical protein